MSFGATILIFYLVTAQRTADFGSIFLNDHTRGKKSDEANILVHYGRICQALSNKKTFFFFRNQIHIPYSSDEPELEFSGSSRAGASQFPSWNELAIFLDL